MRDTLAALLVPLTVLGASVPAPTGLLCNFQASPALGVGLKPEFSWVVAPSASAADTMQSAYQLRVLDDQGATVWDSGRVSSNQSARVPYAGETGLNPAATYSWTVTTWSSDSESSAASAPARFITARDPMGEGDKAWAGSDYIMGGKGDGTFALFRRTIDIPGDVDNAIVFASAASNDETLCAYKLYINGKLVSVGPTRPDAPVAGGDGAFRTAPYVTLDATGFLQKGSNLIAIGAEHGKGPRVLMQLVVRYRPANGGLETLTAGTGSDWLWFDADGYFNPTSAKGGAGLKDSGVEFTDARAEPIGWNTDPKADLSKWANATACAGNCDSTLDASQRQPRMAHPVEVADLPAVELKAYSPPGPAPTSGRMTCAVHKESMDDKSPLSLRCGIDDKDTSGGVIQEVLFADFGTPTGDCANATSGSFKSDSKCSCADKTKQVISDACLNKPSCSLDQLEYKELCDDGKDPCHDVHKYISTTVQCSKPAPPAPGPPPRPSAYYADFGLEFEGGLRLRASQGAAGTKVTITSGELIDSGNTVQQTWGYTFEWTLRDGDQTIEQFKYMEFRYVNLEVVPPNASTAAVWAATEGGAARALGLELSAWRAEAEYIPSDSRFESSDSMLNRVWELSRYTLQAGVLDTFTDSNTRERRPYEADGLIAATGRYMVQRNSLMWARHSYSYILEKPTWPVEWQQMTANLAWADYQATGNTDLFRAYGDKMFIMSKWPDHFDNKTGLVFTGWEGARHIVGWDPSQHTDAYRTSDYQFVSNAFAARAIEILAALARQSGPEYADNATRYASIATALRKNIRDQMWNATVGRYCDGICSDPAIGGFAGPYSAFYSLYLAMVDAKSAPGVWAYVANYTQPGNSNYGDYGAFGVQYALTDFPLFGDEESGLVEANGGGDDGQAVLNYLTKCDDDSWCAEFAKYNATMTGEAFNNGDGTRSHPWGTSAIPAVVQGLVGVQRTSPGYFSFKVKPRLGGDKKGLDNISLRMPSLAGFIDINVTASPFRLEAQVPCNTRASLCVPMNSAPSGTSSLKLDGSDAKAVQDGRHLCVQDVGCGANGASRVVEV